MDSGPITAKGDITAPNLVGSVVQVVNYQTGALASGSTGMQWDDTIPQITEGDQYMSLAITPKSATNKLKIDVVWNGIFNIDRGIIALFQDSTANALTAISREYGSDTESNVTSFSHFMTAGTTSATTFKVRAGGTGATTYFNGRSGSRMFGGVMASSITITEIKA